MGIVRGCRCGWRSIDSAVVVCIRYSGVHDFVYSRTESRRMIRIIFLLLRWPWWRDIETGKFYGIDLARMDVTAKPRLP